MCTDGAMSLIQQLSQPANQKSAVGCQNGSVEEKETRLRSVSDSDEAGMFTTLRLLSSRRIGARPLPSYMRGMTHVASLKF